MEKEDKISKLLISVIIAILGLIVFNICTVETKPNEYILVRQFGKIVDITEESGISFKIPFIQSETSIPKDVRLYDLSASDVITSDKKTMIVDNYVLWKVTDPKKFVQTLSASTKNTEGRINTIVYNATKNTISNMTQDEAIQSRDGKIEVSKEFAENTDIEMKDIKIEEENTKDVVEIVSLSDKIKENIGTSFDQYGIEVTKVDVKVLDLPESNKEAVYNRMISERENIAASYTAQGNSESKKIRNETDAEVTVLLSDANKKATILEAEGESEYMKILSDAYNDESKAEFYTYVRSLDALKKSMVGTNKTVILSKDSPISEIFYGK